MKKLALTFAIVLGMSFGALAQDGGLFGYGEVSETDESSNLAWYSFYQDDNGFGGLFDNLRTTFSPALPIHDQTDNQDAPLTGGALLLIGFGAAYALKKRSSKR